jgi:lipid II isoglutaminyl synthase (glutamine-hydrolysing)
MFYNRYVNKFIGTAIGKSVRHLTRLKGTGGQALPGLVIERLLPNYLASMLGQLPEGVVIITGTNGKTTTTKMVVELLRFNGKRVLTNPTGSNFTRGIISSLAHQAKITGHLPFDIGVFELDEAYARHFVAQVKPRFVLALNVMRDQLDRFGELDTAAKLIAQTMNEATEGIIVNDDDARLVEHAKKSGKHTMFFGVADKLRKHFPTDDEIVAVTTKAVKRVRAHQRLVELADFSGQQVTFEVAGQKYKVDLKITGQHNFQNAAAALALAYALIPHASSRNLVQQLASIAPAFGRGQVFKLKDGSQLELILVKNPAGFRQALASYPVNQKLVMFAVNDNYADGRDTSWLWDVDFSGLKGKSIPLTSGTRAADMALRLSYDGVKVKQVEPDLTAALEAFCNLRGDKLLITTYTAMLKFYKILAKQAGKTL